jgi:pimeloyl-ACP methyl ester carboxylesterase
MEKLVGTKSLMDGPQPLNVNGNNLAIWERPGTDPAVLFFHGAGFHACCWNEVIARIPGRRCIAVDARGHGQSAKPEAAYKWREFGQDAAAVARLLGLVGATGVGHSLGGHAVTLAAAIQPEAFSELVLIDPVVWPPTSYGGKRLEFSHVARRRNNWHSWIDLFYRLKDRHPFDRWHRKVLLDYCEYGLIPRPSGNGYELACPPAVEAAIYQHSMDEESNIYPEIQRIQASVTVVRCGRFSREIGGFSSSPTANDLASRFRHAIDLYLADQSHFLPMEAPHITADIILRRERQPR